MKFILHCRDARNMCYAVWTQEPNTSSAVWIFFFTDSEEVNVIAICNTCSTRVMRGGKTSIKHNKSN